MNQDDGFERSPTEPYRPKAISLDRERIEATQAYDRSERLCRENDARAFLQSSKEFAAMLAHRIDDERTKQLAIDAAAKDIAEQRTKGAIEPSELGRLVGAAVAKALEQEKLEREQSVANELQTEREAQQQRHDEQLRRLQLEPRQNRHYAELHETHRIVGEEITSDRPAPPEQNNFKNERDERSHLGRSADLGVTHQLVDVELRQRVESTTRQKAEMERTTSGDKARSTTEHVEQKGELSDSRRETDDRARLRQARMQEFGREIEEGFHRELNQDSGRDRGR
jgi:hypothetical protein